MRKPFHATKLRLMLREKAELLELLLFKGEGVSRFYRRPIGLAQPFIRVGIVNTQKASIHASTYPV